MQIRELLEEMEFMKDSESEDGVDNSDMEGDNEEEEEEYEIQEGNPSTIRVRGQAERDILRNNML